MNDALFTTAESWIRRGNNFAAANKIDDAIRSYDAALALDPKAVEAPIGKALALASSNRLGEALACCEEALAIAPDSFDALDLKGRVYAGLGQVPDAMMAISEATKALPGGSTQHAAYDQEMGMFFQQLGAVTALPTQGALPAAVIGLHQSFGIPAQPGMTAKQVHESMGGKWIRALWQKKQQQWRADPRCEVCCEKVGFMTKLLGRKRCKQHR